MRIAGRIISNRTCAAVIVSYTAAYMLAACIHTGIQASDIAAYFCGVSTPAVILPAYTVHPHHVK